MARVKKILSLWDDVWIRSYLAARARGCEIVGDDEMLVLMSSMEPTRGEATLMFVFGKYSCSYYTIMIEGEQGFRSPSSSGGAFEGTTRQVSMLSQIGNEVQWRDFVEDLTKFGLGSTSPTEVFQMLFIRPCSLSRGFESRALTSLGVRPSFDILCSML